MSSLTQEELLIKAQSEFDAMLTAIREHTENQTRTDLVERDLFDRFLEIGNATLSAFIACAGDGDVGQSLEKDGKTLHRSQELHRRVYHSIFGQLEIQRYFGHSLAPQDRKISG